jgi:HTH-like domain/Integrase core domain
MTFQLIDRERAHHAVSRLCSVLNVSRQGCWAWKRRPPSHRRQEDERLKPRILEAWHDSDRTYGAPRLHAELRLGDGLPIGKKRVARLMRELEIQGVSRRRGVVRTTRPDAKAPPAPDLINRDFTVERPDQIWVADVTYVPTYEGWLFLGAVMDLYSRKIVGWSMRDDLEAPLVVDAISMAISVASRSPVSSITAIAARSTPRSRWAARYATRRSWPAWARRATRGTTPPQRAASRRSRTRSSNDARSRHATRRGSRSSATSRASTTRSAATPAWRCSAPTSTSADTGRTTPRQPPAKKRRQRKRGNPNPKQLASRALRERRERAFRANSTDEVAGD